MKFYMHCEWPELTVVIQLGDTDRVIRDAVDIFKSALAKQYPSLRLDNAVYSVKSSCGKILQESKSVGTVIKHMDDVYVTVETDEVEKLTHCVSDVSLDGRETHEKLRNTKEIADGKNNAAIIHLGNGRIRKAILLYREMLKEDKTNITALKGLAVCFQRAGRYKESLKYAKLGLTTFRDNTEFLMLAGEACVGLNDGDKAIEFLMKCVKLGRNSGGMSQQEKLDIQVQLAKAYLVKNEKDMAITVLQSVLRECLEHEEALTEYASVLFPLGPKQSEEAMTVIMTVLARRHGDKRAKEVFAEMMKNPKGMCVLKEVAGSVMTDSAALVYLGSCLRDHSVVKEALELIRLALDNEPDNASTALLYLHTLELLDDEMVIFGFIQEYLTRFPGKQVLDLSMAKFYRQFSDILTQNGVSKKAAKFDKCVNVVADVCPVSKGISEDERYLLAFLFTVVKVLYVKGYLLGLAEVLALLEPLYKGRCLHESNIRNEAAYFNCVNELFKTFEVVPSTSPSPGESVLYFVGDSHCFSAAWQRIKLQDRSFLVQPILSTGTKIWHLRPESDFYPKTNFYSAIQRIPEGSFVTVCLGEIDCREALLQCWEKARYEKIEDGMEAVVQIYLQVLKSLKDKHGWTIFVHPVLPVLDVTRPIVLQFNRILATRLLSEPSLHWLNFVHGLLTEDEAQLKEEFQFDNTHIHPKYMTLFADALAAYQHLL